MSSAATETSPLDLGVLPSVIDGGLARTAGDRARGARHRPDAGARIPRVDPNSRRRLLRGARVQRQRHHARNLARHRAAHRAEPRSHFARREPRRRRFRLHFGDDDARRRLRVWRGAGCRDRAAAIRGWCRQIR